MAAPKAIEFLNGGWGAFSPGSKALVGPQVPEATAEQLVRDGTARYVEPASSRAPEKASQPPPSERRKGKRTGKKS